MKRKIIIAFSLIVVILFITSSMFIFKSLNNKSIKKTLNNEYYSYLPIEAKEYIQQVYEETGEILLTEKNKEENVPYLNPQYIAYLELSDEKKQEVDVIPQVLTIEYDYKNQFFNGGDLPATYDLRNYNYITPLKNQQSLGICWAFSTAEQAESYLMIKNNQGYNSGITKIFSPRQIDYATSTNGIKDYTNIHSFRELGKGGNFYMSSEILSYGLSLVDESNMPFTTDYTKKEVSEVLSYTKSNYEVNNTVDLPTISTRYQLDYSTQATECESYQNEADKKACYTRYNNEIRDNYIEQIKIGVKNYGGAVVETMAPGLSCGFKNTNNTYAVGVNTNCYKTDEGHAMHVIGWDDNYSYKYCKGSTSNSDVVNNTCTSGQLIEGTGAFLIRNSWGNSEYAYIYLTYDSINDNSSSAHFHYITDMTKTSDKTWDNSYFHTLDYDDAFTLSSRISQLFKKKISTNEKIEKVKFNTFTVDAPYSIKITNGSNTYSYNNIIETNYPGIYTIDLSDKNIILNEDNFTIEISTSKSKTYALKNSISVFTSNVDKTPFIERIDLDEIKLTEPELIARRILYNTKNISSGSTVNIKLEKITGENFSSYLTVANNIVAENNINTSITINPLPVGKYKLVTNYGSYNDELLITVGEDTQEKYNVIYYANNGTNNSTTNQVEKETAFTLIENPYTKTGYKFIKWNTKADGTGTNYANEATISEGITKDLSLYAQWSPIEYKLVFNSNGGSGNMSDQTLTYDLEESINKNLYTKMYFTFTGWNTKADGTGTNYSDEASVINLTTIENKEIILYAQWERKIFDVVFYANNGTNSRTTKQVERGKPFTLIENPYTKTGYKSIKWNTKADGSGTDYENRSTISEGITKDLSLYAQWSPIEYKLLFNSNGGSGNMSDQTLTYDSEATISKNLFIYSKHKFIGWDTKQDGTGTRYSNEASVINLTTIENKEITLYAQWEESNDFVINYYPVDETNKYITKIKEETEVDTFISYISLNDGYTLDIDYKTRKNKNIIYTGGKTRIKKNNQPYEEYTNVVIGDVDGDGDINSGDLLGIKRHLIDSNAALTGVYFLSADVNYDSSLNSGDLLMIKQHLIGQITIK